MKTKKPKEKQAGICKLTKKKGVFIKSHLIPQAFTRPAKKGSPLFQHINKSTKPIRRWSSWYDTKLVIQEGEDILTKYDTWAVQSLRKKKLVWSGWGKKNKLAPKQLKQVNESIGMREVIGINTKKLRLFILSLLWRAGSSELPEFSEVRISKGKLEQLRVMIVTGNPDPISFFPASFTQLSTKGVVHNQSPVLLMKTIPSFEGTKEHDELFYRFYFDGLIVHIGIEASNGCSILSKGKMIVGAEESFVVTTQSYKGSLQKGALEEVTGYI